MFQDILSKLFSGFITTAIWLALIIGFIAVVDYIGKVRNKKSKKNNDNDSDNNETTDPLEVSDYEKINIALHELSKILSESRFCSYTDIQTYQAKYQDLYKKSKNSPLIYIPVEHRANCAEFITKFISAEKLRKESNENFKREELKFQKDYFDTLFSNPLSDQQREAIITNEDNVLVIAGAGCGKTTTIVGKVRYLLEQQRVDPTRILLVTFTRNAANTLKKKIKNNHVHTSTFHSLAMDIIGLHRGIKPTITATTSIRAAFNDVRAYKPGYIRHLNLFYLYYLKPTLGDFDAKTSVDYFRERKKYGVRCAFNDMDNRPIYTRSEEENMLCNLLTQYGIQFRYEEQYQVDTSNSAYGRYYPDFSIYYYDHNRKKQRLYLEHFGIDKNGRVPSWFGDGYPGGWHEANKKYNAGIQWKRGVHRRYKTKLIETSSADFKHKTLRKRLFKALDKHGVPYKERSATELNAMISKRDKQWEGSILNLIETFIALLKSSLKSIEDIRTLIEAEKDTYTRDRNLFVLNNIIAPVYDRYTEIMRAKGESDFADCIIDATAINLDRPISTYDYIIIDEFQDTSIDKYKFIQSLREHTSHVYCVGDDWQSIYRFAGSDIGLFRDFEEYFGYTEKCKIETTYRFGNPLIDLSSKFIQQNPNQETKRIQSIKGNKTEFVAIPFVQDDDNINFRTELQQVLDTFPADDSVLILGRYNFDIQRFNGAPFIVDDKFNKIKYKGRAYEFMSVHSAKGLEADHIIIANCDTGIYGFPSKVADDLILNYLLSEADSYQYGEERRLFYVAMTRARKKVTFVYDQDNYSVFMKEIVQKLSQSSKLCPRCQDGELYVYREGYRKNGDRYKLVKCDNKNAGCDFKRFDTYRGNLPK